MSYKFFYYKVIDSTQKEAWRRIENNNIEDKTIILSEIQASGIGTHGRSWYTSKKGNIAFSLVLKLNKNIEILNNFTIEIAKIVTRVFKKFYGIKLDIKLPNDIMIGNKKVGGILCETKIQKNIVKYLVIGIGLNTNQTLFDDEIKDISTSINKEFKINIDNLKVVVEICNEIEKELKINFYE